MSKNLTSTACKIIANAVKKAPNIRPKPSKANYSRYKCGHRAKDKKPETSTVKCPDSGSKDTTGSDRTSLKADGEGMGFEVPEYKLHGLTEGPSTTVKLTHKDALKLYHDLYISRHLENNLEQMYRTREVRGFCHLYTGQEAVAVGMIASMRKKDSLIGAYRTHPIVYLIGSSSMSVIAEMCAKKSGVCRGKSGSAHMFNIKGRYYGGHGIIGAQCAIASGVAFAHKYRGDGGVAVTMYGDGAANQGQLHESFNIAKLWNLPVLYICENNLVGMTTLAKRAAASTKYYTRGDYIPGLWVDGQDVLATREATRFALEHVINDKGPIIVEMETYRYTGHSVAEPGTTYRTREEVQEVKKNRDPIINFKKRIVDAGLVKVKELKAIEKEVKAELKESVAATRKDTEPDLSELSADVYVKWQAPNIRGLFPGREMQHYELANRDHTK